MSRRYKSLAALSRQLYDISLELVLTGSRRTAMLEGTAGVQAPAARYCDDHKVQFDQALPRRVRLRPDAQLQRLGCRVERAHRRFALRGEGGGPRRKQSRPAGRG